jgi:hypothetical protein
MAAAMCAYYRGAFERMFRKLVCPHATLRELEQPVFAGLNRSFAIFLV